MAEVDPEFLRPSRTKAILVGVGLAAAFALGLVWWMWKQKQELPEFKYRGKTADLGEFQDWNLGTGHLANELRRLSAEPLLEKIANGPTVYRLVTEIIPPPEAKADGLEEAFLEVVTPDDPPEVQEAARKRARERLSWVWKARLRSEVYWSDGVPLNAQQVVDALKRARIKSQAGSWTAGAEQIHWMRGVELKTEGTQTLVVTGVSGEPEFLELLTSNLLMPVRLDLIEKSPEGWTVSLGPMRLQALPSRPTPLLETIKLVPNENAYRGGASQSVALEVWRYVDMK